MAGEPRNHFSEVNWVPVHFLPFTNQKAFETKYCQSVKMSHKPPRFLHVFSQRDWSFQNVGNAINALNIRWRRKNFKILKKFAEHQNFSRKIFFVSKGQVFLISQTCPSMANRWCFDRNPTVASKVSPQSTIPWNPPGTKRVFAFRSKTLRGNLGFDSYNWGWRMR